MIMIMIMMMMMMMMMRRRRRRTMMMMTMIMIMMMRMRMMIRMMMRRRMMTTMIPLKGSTGKYPPWHFPALEPPIISEGSVNDSKYVLQSSNNCMYSRILKVLDRWHHPMCVF